MNTKKHEVPQELLTSLLANYKKPEDLIGENGLLKQLTKLLVEKALDAELTEHLGHERHESVANASGNTRIDIACRPSLSPVFQQLAQLLFLGLARLGWWCSRVNGCCRCYCCRGHLGGQASPQPHVRGSWPVGSPWPRRIRPRRPMRPLPRCMPTPDWWRARCAR